MVDKVKVAKGLECCAIDNHNDCPYEDEIGCSTKLLMDAFHVLTTPNTNLPDVDFDDAVEHGKTIGYQQAVLEMSEKLKGMKIRGRDHKEERAAGVPGI